MSASRRPTRAPVWPSATARLTATVDLPTPPLPGGDENRVLDRREEAFAARSRSLHSVHAPILALYAERERARLSARRHRLRAAGAVYNMRPMNKLEGLSPHRGDPLGGQSRTAQSAAPTGSGRHAAPEPVCAGERAGRRGVRHAAMRTVRPSAPPASCPTIPSPGSSSRSTCARWRATTMEGRRTGEPGAERAAHYIEQEFMRIGLRPGGDEGSYRQRFTVRTGARLGERNRLAWRASGKRRELVRRPGFPARSGSPPRPATGWRAKTAFCGYGITASAHAYDDYAGLDVDGRIVLLLRFEPGAEDSLSPFSGTELTEHADLRRKVQNAHDHGAVGVMLLTAGRSGPGDSLLGFVHGAGASGGVGDSRRAGALRRPRAGACRARRGPGVDPGPDRHHLRARLVARSISPWRWKSTWIRSRSRRRTSSASCAGTTRAPARGRSRRRPLRSPRFRRARVPGPRLRRHPQRRGRQCVGRRGVDRDGRGPRARPGIRGIGPWSLPPSPARSWGSSGQATT